MVWYHPKYYKELRSIRNKLDQVISKQQATASSTRAPGPGLKPQATSSEPQASSSKPQATETQAASDKLPNSQAFIKFQAASIRGLD